jgi:hypothetical protein
MKPILEENFEENLEDEDELVGVKKKVYYYYLNILLIF